jgi:hypothetical protein
MAAIDWIALRTEFVHGAGTLRDLSKKHGIKEGTISSRAARENWQDERRTLQESARQRIDDELIDERVSELAKFNEDDLKVARALRAKAASMLNTTNGPVNMRALAGVFETAQRMGRLALGASTENSTVSATIERHGARQLEARLAAAISAAEVTDRSSGPGTG